MKIDFTTEEIELLKDIIIDYKSYFEIENERDLELIKIIKNKLGK